MLAESEGSFQMSSSAEGIAGAEEREAGYRSTGIISLSLLRQRQGGRLCC